MALHRTVLIFGALALVLCLTIGEPVAEVQPLDAAENQLSAEQKTSRPEPQGAVEPAQKAGKEDAGSNNAAKEKAAEMRVSEKAAEADKAKAETTGAKEAAKDEPEQVLEPEQAKEEPKQEADDAKKPAQIPVKQDAEEENAEKPNQESDATDQVAEEVKTSEEAKQATEEAATQDAARSPSSDPNNVSKHLEADIANAKTVDEVQNAVEARVSAALVTRRTQDALEKAQLEAKQKALDIEKEAAEAKEQKTKDAEQLEQSKIKLEKARQSALDEKSKTSQAKALVQASKNEMQGLKEVQAAKVKRVKTEEQVKTAEAVRKGEEEKAKQAAAMRITAQEKLKSLKLSEQARGESLKAMPTTVHQMALAQAAALGAAAKLKIQESQALHVAQLSKTKHEAYERMRITAQDAEEAKQAFDASKEESDNDAGTAQEDLKKALASPFNQNALKQVVEERDELKTDTTKKLDSKGKWEAAEQRAQAAKQVVTDGELTNWGQRSAPEKAAEEAPQKVSELKRSDDEPDKPKGAGNKDDYENMSEKEVQYWLAKKMRFMDVDPQKPSEVMDEMFLVKEKEADQMHTLMGLQKGANATGTATDVSSNNDEPMVIDGEIVDPKKSAADLSPAKVEVRAPGEPLPDNQDNPNKKPDSDMVSQMKMDSVTKGAKEEIKQAQEAAQGKTTSKTTENSLAPASSEAGQIAAAEEARTKEAVEQSNASQESNASQKSSKSDASQESSKPVDMGEDASMSLGETELETEVSADDVMERDNLGATNGEGIDTANADAELDDMSIEDDGDDMDNEESFDFDGDDETHEY